jgi:hypothetical protein
VLCAENLMDSSLLKIHAMNVREQNKKQIKIENGNKKKILELRWATCRIMAARYCSTKQNGNWPERTLHSTRTLRMSTRLKGRINTIVRALSGIPCTVQTHWHSVLSCM